MNQPVYWLTPSQREARFRQLAAVCILHIQSRSRCLSPGFDRDPFRIGDGAVGQGSNQLRRGALVCPVTAEGPAGAAVKTRLTACLAVCELARVLVPGIGGVGREQTLAVVPRRAVHRRLAARADVLRRGTARKEQQRENDETRTEGLNPRKHGNTSV